MQAQAQSVPSSCYVTEIVTNYGGYWRSGSGSGSNAPVSSTKPDNSHDLLAFVVNSGTVTVNGTPTVIARKYFSTGVNDALLTSKGLAYNASRYQALSLANTTSVSTSGSYIALGQLYDGVASGAGSPPPAAGFAQYLTDGAQGLDIGTGVANLPAGTIKFSVSSISPSAIGDGVPDILITQIADPSNSTDTFSFLTAADAVVTGTKELSATFTSVTTVGNWMADFYEDNNGAMGIKITNSQRSLRMLAIDFAEFGVTMSNYGSISQFQLKLSGTSDQAFIAYNTNAASIQPLPVTLTAFGGAAQGSRVHLRWATADERNADAFVVEHSADGQAFESIGRVAAAGTSTQAHQYQFAYQPAQPGVGYYRLRQLDIDGSAHFSPVVVVRTGAAAVEVFPTVFGESLTVRLPTAGAVALALLAPDGRVLWQQQLADVPAHDLALPALGAVPPGLYLLRTVVDGQASLHRVVKQ